MTAVRRATVNDAAALAHLLWDFNTEFETETDDVEVLTARFATLLPRDDIVAVLAEGSGEPVGFAFLSLRPAIWFDGPVSQLEELYVVPALRGSGVGTAVLDLSRRLVAAEGSPELHIGVDEVDVDARRFYERHGFVNIEEGVDHRMLYYVGPTVVKAATSSTRHSSS